eukprot:m51a1_g8226 hypothetical protein (500) ;mRNA; f:139917-143940
MLTQAKLDLQMIDFVKPGKDLAYFISNFGPIVDRWKEFIGKRFDTAKEYEMLKFELPNYENMAKRITFTEVSEIQNVINSPGGVLRDAQVHNDPMFRKLAVEGRHHLISIILMTQDPKAIGPCICDNVDVAVIFNQKTFRNKESIWADFMNDTTKDLTHAMMAKYCMEHNALMAIQTNLNADIMQNFFKTTGDKTKLQDSTYALGSDLLLSDAMMAIISKYHSLNTTSPEDIMGKFNAVLEGKIYVVYNEACSLDPIKVNKLKSIITDKNLHVEHKFMDAYTINNMVNILIFSNGTSEKILDLSLQNGQLMMKNGIKCFADYLYNVNIADFNSHCIVITDSLVDQKLVFMHSVHTWWHECLSMGKISYHCLVGLPQLEVDKNDLWGVYHVWVLKCGKKNKISTNLVFFKWLHLVLQFESRRPRMMDRMHGTYIIIPKLPACKEMFRHFCTGATFYDTVPDRVRWHDNEVLPALVKGDTEIRGLDPPRVDADMASMATDD